MSSRSPATGRNELLLASAFFAVAMTLLWQRMYIPHEWGDEGYFANAALRILDGQVLYRDFQHNYPPGRMYSLAFLIEIFGRDLAVVRIFWCVLHASAVALSLLVARRLMPLPFAVATALAVLCNGIHMNKSTELLVASAVLLVVFRVLERRTSDWAAGAWLGLIGLFRHDTAAFGVGLFVLAIALRVWLDSAQAGPVRAEVVDRMKRGAGPFALGVAGALAPFTLYFAIEGALGTALWELSFSGFVANRALALPFPALVEQWSPGGLWEGITSLRALYYIPIVVYAVSLVIALRRLARAERSQAAAQLLLVALLGLALFSQVLVRTDAGHLNKAYLPAHILSWFLVWAAFERGLAAARARRTLASIALLLLAALTLAMPVRRIAVNSMHRYSLVQALRGSVPHEVVEMPYGRMAVPVAMANRFRKVVSTLSRHSQAGNEEYLLAFPAGATLNFLFGYRNPVPYDVLRPGELGGNDAAVLEEVLERLAEIRPRFLVHVRESTNRSFAGEIREFALKNAYTELWAGKLTVFVRPGSSL